MRGALLQLSWPDHKAFFDLGDVVVIDTGFFVRLNRAQADLEGFPRFGQDVAILHPALSQCALLLVGFGNGVVWAPLLCKTKGAIFTGHWQGLHGGAALLLRLDEA